MKNPPAFPTSKSVAAALGISVATISRVLTRPDLVSEKTRAHVLRGIERLGYQPNLAARDLRRGRTGTILMVAPQLGAFFLDILRGVEQAADECNFAVLLANTRGNLQREQVHFAHVANQRADGIILLTGELPSRPGHKRLSMPPLVAALEPLANAVPAVTVDNAGGAEAAVRHLVGLGHQRVAHIAGPDSFKSAGERLAGYRQGLRAARVACDDSLIQRGRFTLESGRVAMSALLEQRRAPTAVFCANDLMAIGALRALEAAGLKVPDDMSVIGFDDVELAGNYDPPLTTVHMPRFDVGYQAMMMLADIVAQKRVRSMSLATRLVIRATSGPPPS